jgi:hypothetical protein
MIVSEVANPCGKEDSARDLQSLAWVERVTQGCAQTSARLARIESIQGAAPRGRHDKADRRFEDMLDMFAGPKPSDKKAAKGGLLVIDKKVAKSPSMADTDRARGLAALTRQIGGLPIDQAQEGLARIRARAARLQGDLQETVLQAARTAEIELVDELDIVRRRDDALALFDDLLARYAPPGTRGVTAPASPHPESQGLTDQQRSECLAKLGRQIGSLPPEKRTNRFGLVGNALVLLPTDAMKASVTAALGAVISVLPAEHQGIVSDLVRSSALGFQSRELQFLVFRKMLNDLEYQDANVAAFNFSTSLRWSETFPPELCAKGQALLASCIIDLPIPSPEPSAFEDVVPRSGNSFELFSGQITNRYHACIALFQRSEQQSGPELDSLLAELAHLDAFEGNPDWAGELCLAILDRMRRVPATVGQIDVLEELAKHVVEAEPAEDCFPALWSECERLGSAVLANPVNYSQSESLIKRLDKIGIRLQEEVFPQFDDDVQEKILLKLQALGVDREAFLAQVPVEAESP